MKWRIHHKSETVSTNLDARAGVSGDVFTADYQSAGRGRLDHKWMSRAGENLMMSVVLGVEGLDPAAVATLPLVIGLSVTEALERFGELKLKWPNDVLCDGRKLSGILCERFGDNVIAGIGVNVRQREFPADILATSVALMGGTSSVSEVRDLILARIEANFAEWCKSGFAALLPRISLRDYLRGKQVSVLRTDTDTAPFSGLCNGIAEDGSLLLGTERIYSGEAHICSIK